MKITPKQLLITLISSFAALVAGTFIYIYVIVGDGLPPLELLENPRQNFATQIMSSDGELLDHFFIQKRINCPLDSMPKDLVNALIAVEDKSFYSHWGVHVMRIFKAAFKSTVLRKHREGASTITMQLARNLYFNQEITMSRKLKEALTAIQIEKTYTKEEILEMYLNTVNYGRGAYGIQVAAFVYFDKQPYELTLPESAFLIGLLKAPEIFNGYGDYEKALRRRNLVLGLMKEQELITQSQFVAAIQEPITLAKNKASNAKNLIAPHFVEMIRQQLSKDVRLKDYDLYRDGLIIYTTLNSKIQKYAQDAVTEHMPELQKTFINSWSWANNKELLNDQITEAIRNNPLYNSAQGTKKSDAERKLRNDKKFIDSVKNAVTTAQIGLVVLDPTTGAILAMVGASPKFMKENSDAKYSLNHTTQIRRQPGSSFKPIVYASAIQEGIEPTSYIECGPFSYKTASGEIWSPRGTGGAGAGQTVTLFEGLAKSINTVAARLITQVTSPQKVIALAKKMGIQSELRPVPSLALGAGGEVTPIEMTSAIGTFANEGIHVPYFSITRIEDQFGNIIYERKKTNEAEDAMRPKHAQLVTKMMQGVVDHGTGSQVRAYFQGYEAAGKTGTTNDYADAWFVGFTPQLVAGVWVGFDDHRVTFQGGYAYAAKSAAPVWGRLMSKIYNDPYLPYKQRKFSFGRNDSLDAFAQIENENVLPETHVSVDNQGNEVPVENKNTNNDDNGDDKNGNHDKPEANKPQENKQQTKKFPSLNPANQNNQSTKPKPR